MPITFIAFGPGKSYTVVYKNGWHTSAREGSSVLALKQKVKDEGGTIHSFAFGEGGSWFISYDLPDGKSRWRWEGIDVQYPALKKWLDDFSKRSWTAKGLTLALGPDGSYWAWEKSRGFSYCNLDQKLIDRLLEDKDKRYTQNVTLGLDGSFIYWNDRGGSLISIRGYEGAADWLNPRVRSEGGRLKIAVCLNHLKKSVTGNC